MAWAIGIGIFLFLLFNFPKQVVALFFVLAVVGGSLFAWNYWDQQARQAEIQSVLVSTIYSTEACSTDYPMVVTIRNGSKRVLTQVTFDIKGNRPGYSRAIMDSSYRSYTSDKIIAAGKDWTMCWTAPGFAYDFPQNQQASVVPSALEWKVENIHPVFEQP